MTHTANNPKQAGGMVLHLVLTHHWYDQTESGWKCVEYRAMTDRWRKRIWEKRDRITAVRFARGYTSRTITLPVERIDVGTCPISGWNGEYYRIHFSPNRPPQESLKQPVAWYHNDFGVLELSRVQRLGWRPLYAPLNKAIN